MQTMHNKFFYVVLLLFFIGGKANAQSVAIKSDAFSTIAFFSPNIGMEYKLTDALSLNVTGNYNPLPRSGDFRRRHWLLNTGIRYWKCNVFSGHFVSAHVFAGEFNLAKISLPFNILPDVKSYRHEGSILGAGVSYGYHWALSPRWGIEVEAGIGAAYSSYEIFNCYRCGEKIDEKANYFLTPTKLAFSFVYILK